MLQVHSEWKLEREERRQHGQGEEKRTRQTDNITDTADFKFNVKDLL